MDIAAGRCSSAVLPTGTRSFRCTVSVELCLQMRVRHRPADAAILDAHRRRGIGQHAVGQGAVGPVTRGLGIEIRHVVVQQEGVRRGDQVAAVAEAFAVRAVGLHAKQVAQKRPLAHFLDAVQQIVGAGECTDGFHAGVHATAFDGIQRRAAGQPRQLDIAEGVEGKLRGIGFVPAAGNVGFARSSCHAGMGWASVRAPARQI